jgi:hypothetical protein
LLVVKYAVLQRLFLLSDGYTSRIVLCNEEGPNRIRATYLVHNMQTVERSDQLCCCPYHFADPRKGHAVSLGNDRRLSAAGHTTAPERSFLGIPLLFLG